MNNSNNSEMYVLGTIIFKNDMYLKVADFLKEDDFYSTRHKLVYKAIKEAYKLGNSFDVYVIINMLQKSIEEKAITETEILNIASCCETATFDSHVKIVKEESNKRVLQQLSKKILSDSSMKSSEIINDMQNLILNINSYDTTDRYISMSEAVEDTLKDIEKAYNTKSGITGISTGLEKLDDAMNGIQRKEMTVFAARPSMGKTAFSLELIKNMEANILYVQLDMSINSMIQRMMGANTGINSGKISRGRLNDGQWTVLSEVSNYLSNKKNIFFYQPKKPTISKIMAKAKEIKIKEGLDIIIIDHIGKIIPETKGTKYEQMTTISNELKRIAIELDIGMIVLCQLNREVEKRYDKKPKLSDLRDSGAIEEDADNIGLLYREGYYKEREGGKALKNDILELSFLKVRNGQLGNINFDYNLKTQLLTQIME